MFDTGKIGLLLLIANVIVSYRGFNHPAFFEKYKFEVDKITLFKDYKRLVTSGFLHVNWMHLIFNMISLYLFSFSLEAYLGSINFLLVYFASLAGGNLLSLLIHKNAGDYSSVGSSGAICGIIFASVALFPGMRMGLLFLPIAIPGWLFGLLFVAFSIYGIRSKNDNIGHEAHLGGALIGMLVALLIHPGAIVENYITILLISVPILAFIYLIITRPHMLLVDNLFYTSHEKNLTLDQRYNIEKHNEQEEIDKILDKIGKKGMQNLSAKEKQRLKDFSKKQ